MRFTKLLYPVIAAGFLLVACSDESPRLSPVAPSLDGVNIGSLTFSAVTVESIGQVVSSSSCDKHSTLEVEFDWSGNTDVISYTNGSSCSALNAPEDTPPGGEVAVFGYYENDWSQSQWLTNVRADYSRKIDLLDVDEPTGFLLRASIYEGCSWWAWYDWDTATFDYESGLDLRLPTDDDKNITAYFIC